MAQWHPDLLNRHIAPGIADFTACEIPDLAPEFERASSWISTLFMVSALQSEYKGNARQFVSNIVFRGHACFELYHQARDTTMEFIAKSSLHSPRLLTYYRAARTWEACLINLQVLTEVVTKLSGKRMYVPADGSVLQRAYDMANLVKHWGKAINSGAHDEGDTLPLWLSNAGLVSRPYSLSYLEIAELIRDAAEAAEQVYNPIKSAKTPAEAETKPVAAEGAE